MNTTAINAQLAGPLELYRFPLGMSLRASGECVAMSGTDTPTEQPTFALLAAAYTAFDRAGRTLNVDAALLAESIDVAALVCAARDAIALMRQLSDEQLAPVQDALDGLVCALDPIP